MAAATAVFAHYGLAYRPDGMEGAQRRAGIEAASLDADEGARDGQAQAALFGSLHGFRHQVQQRLVMLRNPLSSGEIAGFYCVAVPNIRQHASRPWAGLHMRIVFPATRSKQLAAAAVRACRASG